MIFHFRIFAVASLFLIACSSDTETTTPAPAPTTPPAADAGTESGTTPLPSNETPENPIPTSEGCVFMVDGTRYESAAGDVFTLASTKDGGLSIQCVAVVGDKRFTLGFVAAKVSGPGAVTALGSFSEQPTAGGSVTSMENDFKATILTSTIAPSVIGNARFSTSATKKVSASFNLPAKN